jgi:predicted dehydrogenase
MQTINLRPDWTWSFKREAESFVKTVLTGAESIASGADGLEDLRFIEDIWRHIVG